MANTTFSFTVDGNFTLGITIGSYATPLAGAPDGKILRLEGVGEFRIPENIYQDAENYAGSLDSRDIEKAKVFLDKVLSACLTKVK